MMKPLFVGLLCAAVTGITVLQAQTGSHPAPRHQATTLLNENYLTATGETVAHPGASQGAATTSTAGSNNKTTALIRASAAIATNIIDDGAEPK